MNDSTTDNKSYLLWAWLFPGTYLVHIAEEYWGGEGFHHWASRMAGINLTAEAFLNLNALFWLFMTALVALAFFRRSQVWLLVTLGTVVLVNGLLHTGMSLLTGGYSPGLISGILLWIPLGSYALYRLRKNLTAMHYLLAVIAGILLHLVVFASALSAGM